MAPIECKFSFVGAVLGGVCMHSHFYLLSRISQQIWAMAELLEGTEAMAELLEGCHWLVLLLCLP